MAVDESPWDGPAAMSRAAASDDPAAAYEAICAGRKAGDPALQSSWALPHHENPGDPPNAAGVAAAEARFSQTQGLTNEAEALAHLRAHSAEIDAARNRSEPEPEHAHEPELVTTGPLSFGELEVRSVEAREIGALIVPYNEVVDTPIGLEMFRPGSFSKVDPKKVVLLLEHQGPPAGRGKSIEERPEGPYMVFGVSKTPRGDELLTLARDGVTGYVSVGYEPGASKSEVSFKDGRRVTEHVRTALREVSTTWKPYYERAAVLSVRSREGDSTVSETTEPVAIAPVVSSPDSGDVARIAGELRTLSETNIRLVDRISDLEERSRREIIVPGRPGATQSGPSRIEWLRVAMRMLIGDRIPSEELQRRDLEDIVTSDAPGVVPTAFLPGLIGDINPQRPFLASTRNIAAPGAGMSATVPVLGTRAITGKQSGEKQSIASGPVTVTPKTFDAITIAGGADVSIQLIRRSDPSFADLLMQELAEDYAFDADSEAVAALFAAGTTPGTGNIDPEDLTIGEAWANSLSACKRPPDTIWLSSEAVQAFIDAKANTTNAPLYGTLGADFTVSNGVGGRIQGLRPVYVPALDGTSVDVIVGPSSRFAWAEDGTFTLQVDVPAKAGRDIALVGILFLMPLSPAAFTTYDLGS